MSQVSVWLLVASKVKGPKKQLSRSKPATQVPGAYERELAQLGSTYVAARTSGGAAIKLLLEQIEDRPVIFVGSGGALAVAQFAADLHLHATGRVARAVTPLEFGAMRLHSETALVMFSASGKHPDAAMTITSAKVCGYAVIGVVTLRPEADLPPALRGDRVQVVTAPSDVPKDGFLATNSVLAMATTLVAGRASTHKLSAMLPLLEQPIEDVIRGQCLVLYGPGHACVALDLESRLHEIGLAAVQVSDYRNFAHGRHAGLTVQRFVAAIVNMAQQENVRPTVPYPPGVTGTALFMTDIQRLADPQKRARIQGGEELFNALTNAVAHNVVSVEQDRPSKNKQVMVIYLNRLLCPRFGLVLGRGGFREKKLEMMARWMLDPVEGAFLNDPPEQLSF